MKILKLTMAAMLLVGCTDKQPKNEQLDVPTYIKQLGVPDNRTLIFILSAKTEFAQVDFLKERLETVFADKFRSFASIPDTDEKFGLQVKNTNIEEATSLLSQVNELNSFYFMGWREN